MVIYHKHHKILGVCCDYGVLRTAQPSSWDLEYTGLSLVSCEYRSESGVRCMVSQHLSGSGIHHISNLLVCSVSVPAVYCIQLLVPLSKQTIKSKCSIHVI